MQRPKNSCSCHLHYSSSVYMHCRMAFHFVWKTRIHVLWEAYLQSQILPHKSTQPSFVAHFMVVENILTTEKIEGFQNEIHYQKKKTDTVGKREVTASKRSSWLWSCILPVQPGMAHDDDCRDVFIIFFLLIFRSLTKEEIAEIYV